MISIFDSEEFWGYSTNAQHESMLFCFAHIDIITVHRIFTLPKESIRAFRAY